MPFPLLLAAAAAPSVIKGISSLFTLGQGKRMARNNPFPTEQVNPLLQQNLAIAENMGRVGLPQEQYNNSINNINRNQSGALNMFARNPNGTNLASIVRASNDATMNLDARDAAARQGNQRFAIGQRGILANEQNRVWDWNKRQRYIQNAQAAGQTMAAGRQGIQSSLNDLSQLGQYALMGKQGQQSSTGNSNFFSNSLSNSRGQLFNQFNQPTIPMI